MADVAAASFADRASHGALREPAAARSGVSAARGRNASDLPITTEERIIEPTNWFEGGRLRFPQVLAQPRAWPHLVNPLKPSWGEAYVSIEARMLAAIDDAWRPPRAAKSSWSATSCRSGWSRAPSRRCARARPPQPSLHAVEHHDARPRRRPLRRGRLSGTCGRIARSIHRSRSSVNRRLIAVVVAFAALTTVSCSSPNDSLAQQYQNGSEEGYISGDGSTVEIPAEQSRRTDHVRRHARHRRIASRAATSLARSTSSTSGTRAARRAGSKPPTLLI